MFEASDYRVTDLVLSLVFLVISLLCLLVVCVHVRMRKRQLFRAFVTKNVRDWTPGRAITKSFGEPYAGEEHRPKLSYVMGYEFLDEMVADGLLIRRESFDDVGPVVLYAPASKVRKS